MGYSDTAEGKMTNEISLIIVIDGDERNESLEDPFKMDLQGIVIRGIR